MSHPRIYAALKYAGHCPANAAEIILDARRGDRYALQWVRACTKFQRIVILTERLLT